MKRKFSKTKFTCEFLIWLFGLAFNLSPVVISNFKYFSTITGYTIEDIVTKIVGSLDFQFVFISILFVAFLQICYAKDVSKKLKSFFQWSVFVVVASLYIVFSLLYSFDNVRVEIFDEFSVPYNLIVTASAVLLEIIWLIIAAFAPVSEKGVM